MFDIQRFKNIKATNSRYKNQLERLKRIGLNSSFIETAISDSSKNLKDGTKSFVIYGEPQSGKTEMMICLTARLLDEGKRIIVVLLNDNVELLKQNLRRFKESGIDPDPKNFSEVIDTNVEIGSGEWVIFCKKNSNDLKKLIEKIRNIADRVIIDDEADYASPNAKKNRGEITKINQLIGQLLGANGTYIGVTATPARLDLNNTFDNANDCWVNFPAHQHYTGQDVFFPMGLGKDLSYLLTLLPDHRDDPKYLRNAIFSFFVNVGYLNTKVNSKEKNYCMLVHTSGKRADHTEDYKQIMKAINVLKDNQNSKFEDYVKAMWEIANSRFGEQTANEIITYILQSLSRTSPVIMNSDIDKKNVDYSNATNPTVPFTIAIGGNIISRGVTFHNLLSMFFTRDVKHKIQQDTYIQRARMFGSRNEYVKFFELTIPEQLFMDWHRCFVFHRLALESIKVGNGVPVWLEDFRISAVSASSIDRTTVAVDSGEMSFDIFDLTPQIEFVIEEGYARKRSALEILKEFNKSLGNKVLPSYLIAYIERVIPEGDHSIAIHKSHSIASYGSSADQEKIERARGFIGQNELEEKKFPKAMHHFKIFHNSQNKARIFYRYIGNIKFLKNLKKYLT